VIKRPARVSVGSWKSLSIRQGRLYDWRVLFPAPPTHAKTRRTHFPPDLPAPSGFSVTPAQAGSIITQTPWTLSLKHDCQIYADSCYYYVRDTFFNDGQRRAFTQGVRVDGKTGEIVRR
jgi:hypothetical protein